MLRENKVVPRIDSSSLPSGQRESEESNHSPRLNVQSSPEEESLLSKINDKKINEEFTGWSMFLCACFCPCLFLGHLDSMVARERPLCSCKHCPRCSFGKSGCFSCISYCALCALGWPLSPCLSCSINRRSSQVSVIYDRNVPQNKKDCSSSLIWPKTLLKHILLYEQLEREGRLFYNWTLNNDVQNSLKSQHFNTIEHAVLIVGGKGVGKTDLLSRLCGRNLYEKRENTFENNEVRVGFRPVNTSSRHVAFVEFWDVPVLHLQSIHTIRAGISHVLVMFDVTRRDSINEMINIYDEIRKMEAAAKSKFIVVASKNDYLHFSDAGAESNPNYLNLKDGSDWARSENMEFLSISTTYNIGVHDIFKMVNRNDP